MNTPFGVIRADPLIHARMTFFGQDNLGQVLDNLRLSPLEKGDVISVQHKELRQGWLSSAST